VDGVILSDQIRNLDWRSREAKKIEDAPKKVVEQVIENIELLID